MRSQSSPEVSVIVPTHNRKDLLQRCVASVLGQSHQNIEIIIVDDASMDGTWPWLLEVADPKIRPIRLEKRSERSVARNRGLTAACGQFVMFLDDDDHLLPTALGNLVSNIRASATAVAVAGARIDNYETVRGAHYPHPKYRCLRTVWQELVAGWVLAQGQYICRTETVRAIGGWNEELRTAEDVDFWFRLDGAGPIMFIPDEVLCVEHIHAAGRPYQYENAKMWKQIRRDYVANSPPGQDNLGIRILGADDVLDAARAAYYKGAYAQSLMAYVQFWRLVPELLRSPILGPSFRMAMIRAALGTVLRKRGMRAAKALVQSLLRAS